jgi:hypothetical protein
MDTVSHDTPQLSIRLAAFANHQSIIRQQLSWSSANQISNRDLKCKTVQGLNRMKCTPPVVGRGCVFGLSLAKLAALKDLIKDNAGEAFISSNDVLLALLWHSMVKARMPSLEPKSLTYAKLLIPVNIRQKLKMPLLRSYFGAAVDFGSAQMAFTHLLKSDPVSMAQTAVEVRRAVNSVDEPYIRQAIALARFPDSKVDVRDLQASNMDRANAADMYVTSWEKMPCYDATFGLDLGKPDWVRKPWSRDPGSCIVLPQDPRKDVLEVVIQMKTPDMGRLLEDPQFMVNVVRVIE